MIYLITSIFRDPRKFQYGSTRTFGYFHDLDNAISAVENNYADMQERLYNYIVIEELSEGVHSFVEKEYWYNWVGERSLSENSGKWVLCEKPDWAAGTINWGIG
jgi:hypothetical protein